MRKSLDMTTISYALYIYILAVRIKATVKHWHNLFLLKFDINHFRDRANMKKVFWSEETHIKVFNNM